MTEDVTDSQKAVRLYIVPRGRGYSQSESTLARTTSEKRVTYVRASSRRVRGQARGETMKGN